jgi:hypothetical protein
VSAVTWTPGVYYRHLCTRGSTTFFGVTDVENWATCVPLGPDEIVLCVDIVKRKGGKGRGRYAKLLHTRGGREVVLYHRVSRNNIGSGNWEEVNAMMVLALADQIPTI